MKAMDQANKYGRARDRSAGLRRSLGLLLAFSFLFGQVVRSGAEEPVTFIGTLGLGGSLFQDGEYVPQARANIDCEDGSHDAAGNRACWTYAFDLIESGPPLRIAIDSATRGD